MPSSDKTVKVTLVAVATPYVKGTTEASAATKKLGKDIETTAAKTKGLEAGAGRASGALKGMAIGAGALAATGLVKFLGDTVKAAGDLQQSLGGVDAVFKSNAEQIHRFGKESAEAVGLSTNAFNELVTVSGAMLKNKGIADFTDQSLNLVKVGADLAAQFGGPTSQAVEALNAAMRGESDPIERYGISLNETAVNAELTAQGLEKVNGKFTEQQKTVARLALIQKQSGDALGAFGREADTLQGQQQRLNAEWENAQAELGSALLPALTDVTKALRAGVDVAVAAGNAWGEIPGPVKAAVGALVLYKLTSDRLTTGLVGARTAIRGMRQELELQQALSGGITGGYQRLGDEVTRTGQAVSRTAVGLGVASKAARGAGTALLGAFGGPVGLAITGLTVAVAAFATKQAEAKARVDDLRSSLDQQTGAITDQTRALVAQDLQQSGLLDRAQKLGVSSQLLVRAYAGEADALEELVRMQERANKASESVSTTADDLQKQFGLTTSATIDWTGSSDDAGESARQQAGAWNSLLGEVRPISEQMSTLSAEQAKVGEAAGVAATAEQEFGDATATTTGKVEDQARAVRDAAQAVVDAAEAKRSAFDAEIGYQAALDDTAAAIKENGKSAKNNGKELDVNTESGRENAKALKAQADEAIRLAKENLNSGASLKSLREGIDGARDAFVDNAIKMGLSREAAKKLATELGLTRTDVDNLATAVDDLPASKQIKVEAETAAAQAELKLLETQLAKIKSKQVVVTATTRFVNTDKLPNGGRSTAGGSTFADGGHVTGPGTGKSDSIPAWLSNGEYVLKAAAVAKYGTNLLDQMNAMRFAEGGAVRYGSRTQVVQVPSGPTSHAVTNDNGLHAEVVNITTADARSFERDLRRGTALRAKARPGR